MDEVPNSTSSELQGIKERKMMYPNELVTIVIVVYNLEKYIDCCIESVVNQSYKNLEILVIDDGSTDNSPFLCDQWAMKDNRISVIHKPNGGVSSARNVGITSSHGRYLALIDGDDYVEPDYIQIMLHKIIEEKADLVACGYREVDTDKNALRPNMIFPWKEGRVSGREAVCLLENEHQTYYFVLVTNKLFRRELFDELMFPLGVAHEDAYIMYELLYSCNSVYLINDIFYNYVQHSESTQHNLTDASYIAYINLFEQKSVFYNEHNDYYLSALNQIHTLSKYREHGKVDKEKQGQLQKRLRLALKNKSAWRKTTKIEKIKFLLSYVSLSKYLSIKETLHI